MEPALYQQMAELEQTHWWYRGRRSVLRATLLRHLGKESDLRILDVGCGTGGDFFLLSEFGTVDGVDSSSEAIGYCRQRFGDKFRLFHGSLPESLPPGSSYDAVTAFDVIEHIEEPAIVLKAIHSVLKPGGLLICTVPAYDFLWSHHDDVNHHFRRYTRSLLDSQLRASGFGIRWMSYFNALLFPPIAAVRLAQKALGSKSKSNDQSDLAPTPASINAVLKLVFSAEKFLVPRLSLPFGVSLLAVAERVEPSS